MPQRRAWRRNNADGLSFSPTVSLSALGPVDVLFVCGGVDVQHAVTKDLLTALLGLFRSALLASPLPEVASIVFLLIVATTVLGAGLLFFRRTRPTLVDLI